MIVSFDQVFLVHRSTPEVEVNDTATLALQRHVAVNGLAKPNDMSSSIKHSCLYVADRSHTYGRNRFVNKVELNWSTKVADQRSCYKSVCDVGWIQRHRHRDLWWSTYTKGIHNMWRHGERNTSTRRHGLCLACGTTDVRSVRRQPGRGSDSYQRVCLVVVRRCVLKCFLGSTDGKMNVPIRLAVDQGGSVLVVDKWNKIVLQLSAHFMTSWNLYSWRDVIKALHPDGFLLQEQSGIVYIFENELDGNALISCQLVTYKLNFWFVDWSQLRVKLTRTSSYFVETAF